MKIAAIDIAYKKPIVVSVVSERGKVHLISEIMPSQDIYHTVNDVLDKILPLGSRTLVVAETPLIINNMNTAYVMTRFYAMLEKGTRDGGLMFFGVHPQAWQKEILNPQKGDNRKKLSKEAASVFMKREVKSADIADSINIGRYAYLHKSEILRAISGKGKFSEKPRKPQMGQKVRTYQPEKAVN